MKIIPWKWNAAAAVLGLLLNSCTEKPTEQAVVTQPPAVAKAGHVVIDPNSPQLMQIRSESLEASMVPVGSVSAPGKVEANQNRQSHVVLPLAGRVTTVLVKIGDFVREGQPLLTFESADIDTAVSGFQQAQAVVMQTRSALAKAQMDLDREKDLFEHGAVAQKEVLNAQTMAVQAQGALEQSQAAVENAGRRLQILGVGSSSFGQRVTIHAPISGKILEMSVATGEFRNDLSAPLLMIADLSSVWVTSDVPETAIRFIKTGEPVKIELAAYPGDTFRGRVALIGDVVDPQTRTIKVRAELANPDGRLKPEMFGNIQLTEQTEQRPTVLWSAIIASEGKTLVWRENSKGVFERVAITTGARVGDRVAVLDGLKATDRVVVDGVMLLVSR